MTGCSASCWWRWMASRQASPRPLHINCLLLKLGVLLLLIIAATHQLGWNECTLNGGILHVMLYC